MTWLEYKKLIPHHCLFFPHYTSGEDTKGDACWSILYGYVGRVGACDSCDCTVWAKRKREFWEPKMFDQNRLGQRRW